MKPMLATYSGYMPYPAGTIRPGNVIVIATKDVTVGLGTKNLYCFYVQRGSQNIMKDPASSFKILRPASEEDWEELYGG